MPNIDIQIAQAESKLKKIYSQAEKDMAGKIKAFHDHFKKEEDKLIQGLKDGTITPPPGETKASYLRKWRRNQYAQEARYKALKADISNRMLKANQMAADYVNGVTPGVYTAEYNHMNSEIERLARKTGVDPSFALISDRSITAAMEENHTDFRVLSVNPVRDYRWNTQQIQSALTQGILQGEGIGEIAERFMKVMQNNHKAAVRNARTAVTSAHNAGRQASMDEAASKGVIMDKEWVAGHDGHTRPWHLEADGQIVGREDCFIVDGEELEYPGDPAGSPRNVYNCRCTIVSIFKGYESKLSTDEKRHANLKIKVN